MILFKKAYRSILDNKKAYFACIALIAVAIVIYTAMGILVDRMTQAKSDYYRDYRFADVFASVAAMPITETSSILKIEGVADASARLVYDARVLIPDNEKIITLRLISVDTETGGVPINGFMIKGNNFSYSNDIMVGGAFLNSHKLKIGDSLRIIIENKEVEFNICAEAAGPEFVYVIKNSAEILPDSETFGIAYVPQSMLFTMTGKYNIANDVSIILNEGSVFDDVKLHLEDELQRYGLSSLYPRKDQTSDSMLMSELNSQKAMSQSVPVMFMMMAGVILYLMIKRVIEQERLQIGTLKAFGYTNGEILAHYLLYGFITGLAGGILGDILGYFSAGSMLNMMLVYYNLPMKIGNYPPKFFILGLTLAIMFGVVGAFAGAKSALKLNPAEAMRPSAPPLIKKNEANIPFLYIFLSSRGHMAMRNMMRSKVRSIFIVIGVMFSFGMLAFMGSYDSMIDDMLINLVTKVQVYNIKINFRSPVSYTKAIEDTLKLKSVLEVEGLMEIPAELHNKYKKKGTVITGISEDSNLYKLYDNTRKINLTPSRDGVILSTAISTKLDVKKGDKLLISSVYLAEDLEIYVSDILDTSLGSGCYMEINSMSEFFGINKAATSVILNSDNIQLVKDNLLEAKNVIGVEDKDMVLNNYTSMLDTYMSMIYFMEIAAGIIAFAIIYNASTISLSERKREYATLRVLGMHVKEVGEIVSFEYWFLSIIGMILGIPFTQLMKQAIASQMDVDLFVMPTSTPIAALIIGAVGCAIAVFLSNMSAVSNIKKFDMVEVLKERE